MKFNFRGFVLTGLLGAAALASGCSSKSYPSAELKDALTEITRNEYGIQNVDVKFDGTTIGVYLPLKKLFAADFKGAVVAGKVRNLETLFEPSPEALEQVEDVLFSISRVLLSTDRNIEFYVLQATDIENTGLQLVLTGHVDDVKRVRVWDISRNEYRKRVIHEMSQNRAVLWHKPIREFFDDLSAKPIEEIMKTYFETIGQATVQGLFFDMVGGVDPEKPIEWRIEDIRSARVQRGEVLIYSKVKPVRDGSPLLAEDAPFAEYLFLVSFKGSQPTILRIIPFQYRDEAGAMQKIPFPEDIKMEKSLESWEQEFQVKAIDMGDFLSDQLTRRIQFMIGSDERIQNTFRDLKVSLKYEKDEEEPHFLLVFDSVILADPAQTGPVSTDSLIFHEDMLYLLNMISREFVEVTRSYKFGDYEYLSVNIAQEPGEVIIPRDNLELFRKKKIDLQGLLSPSTI